MNKSLPPIETMLFMRRLADLTHGGMTLYRSLAVLQGQSKSPKIQALFRSIQGEIENGQSLSAALSIQNGTFSPLSIGLIRAGESAGNIESALEESAVLLETELETKQRIRTALAYPAFLLFIAFAVCVFLITFVIPRFEFLFQDLGQNLPLPTRCLITFSTFVVRYGWILFLLGGAAIFIGRQSKIDWKSRLQELFLRIPVFSDVITGTTLQRWAQMMGSLLKNGFTLSAAIEVSGRALGQSWGSKELINTLERLNEGHSFKSALEASPFFPQLVCELIGAGEESSRLEETFARIAQSYKRETELRSKLLLSLMEPALIAVMGLVVGFVALAMLLPIFEMSASFR